MSESSFPASDSLTRMSGTAPDAPRYELSDDLARLCLPQEFQDACRTLAWANSICLLFLIVGLVGLKPPPVVIKPLSEIVETVPVIFTPAEEPPKPEPDVKPDDAEPPKDVPTETPQVVTVVAAADPTSVAFAVPVQGAVAVASAVHLATPPPPPMTQAPPKPVQFNPNVADGGSYPPPNYPGVALRNRYQGTVLIEIMVDPNGTITSAKVQKSSGYSALDDAALDVVKKRWRFPPGQQRWLHWPCIFAIQ